MQKNCSCGSICALKELRLCEEHHRYFLGDRRLSSVSSVINSVLPTDFSKIQEAVLENARERGEWVDRMFCRYLSLRSGENFTTEPARSSDRMDYLERLIQWWDKSGLDAVATQQGVYSEADGIAGTLDIRLSDGRILDLKCVAALRASYGLQLGSYWTMGAAEGIGILHVTKDNVKLIPYDHELWGVRWKTAVDWWKLKQQLKPEDDSIGG